MRYCKGEVLVFHCVMVALNFRSFFTSKGHVENLPKFSQESKIMTLDRTIWSSWLTSCTSLSDHHQLTSFNFSDLQNVQTEMVLMVLLRLAEDVMSMDSNLHANRKKQITQELHSHMDGLFTFFIDTLQQNTARFRSLKVSPISLN